MILYARKLLYIIVLFFLYHPVSAQIQLQKPVNIAKAYHKGTRSDTGKPGINYWQNTASYHIEINFDPKTRLIKGTVDIDYVNNSPDTLNQLLFKLYPNLYKKGVARDAAILPEDLTNGVEISGLTIDNKAQDIKKMGTQSTNLYVPVTAICRAKRCTAASATAIRLTKHRTYVPARLMMAPIL